MTTVKWLGHASFKITSSIIIYIDPWKLKETPRDGDLILVSHSHYDHYSAEDVAKITCPDAELIAPQDVVDAHGSGKVILPGQSLETKGVVISAVASYNPDKQFHPQSNKWVGFIIELEGKKIYYAGDTDMIPEMGGLEGIDLALLPVGGTYTMNAQEAAEAVGQFAPKQAVPYHWGDIVGGRNDADDFAAEAKTKVIVLEPGEELSL